MNRREFVKSVAATGVAAMAPRAQAFAAVAADPLVGKRWPGWKEGEFLFHVIYNGRAESDFCIVSRRHVDADRLGRLQVAAARVVRLRAARPQLRPRRAGGTLRRAGQPARQGRRLLPPDALPRRS